MINIDTRLLYESRPSALMGAFDVALIETLKEETGLKIGSKLIPYSKCLEKDRLDKILPDTIVHEFKGGVFVYSYHDSKAPVKFVVRETDDLYLFVTALKVGDIPHRSADVKTYSNDIERYVQYFKKTFGADFNVHLNFIVFREINVPTFDIEEEFSSVYGDTKVIHFKNLKRLDDSALALKYFE